MRLIDSDCLLERLTRKKPGPANQRYTDGFNDATMRFRSMVHGAPTVDAVPVVRCRECEHRPTKPEKYDDGFDLVFPDEACPCYCDDDPFYSWYPSDDWFCPRGERKGGTSGG